MIEVKDENVEKTGVTIKKKVAKDAILVLKKLNVKISEGKSKKPLFNDLEESPVLLQVIMKKIPPKKMKCMVKVQLPHPLLTDTTEVCLITGDLDKHDKKAEIEPTILHYKELLNKHGVKGISEVVPLRQLRTEYKTYESKRQLSEAYDIFLNDKKITSCLPKLLGKAFYDKRKFPIQINLNTTNLKEQVEKAVSETVFTVSCRGNSCTSEVARLSMDDKDILENILACVKRLEEKIPGKGINILGVYIKTAKSEAIPIYMTFDDQNKLKIKAPRHHEKVKAEELSTVRNATVKVFKDGRIIVKDIPGSEDENSADEADAGVKPTIKRKKTSAQEAESNDEESQNTNEETEIDTNEKQSKSKKRKIKNENNAVENSIKVEDVKSNMKRKKSIKQETESNEESQSIEEETSLNTDDKMSKSTKRMVKKKNNLVKEETSLKANDIKPKRKTDKKVKIEDEEKHESLGEQEAASNEDKKHSKSKRNMQAKNEVEVSNLDEEESKVDIESSVQKKSKKRKSVNQNIENEQVADFNANKKLLKSKRNMKTGNENSIVDDTNDKLETDIQEKEETKVHIESSAQKKSKKRKSKSSVN